jgi:succinate dehydrogenase / fumarate reductase flavoprotein subunit
MSNVPGLYVLGEANFSDHGANRLGASALMQGLADGYFILPQTIANYFAGTALPDVRVDDAAFRQAEQGVQESVARLLAVSGRRTVDDFHRELGLLLWEHCGMARNAAGLDQALERIPEIRTEFWENVTVVGSAGELNQTLERAGRVADFLEFAELMVADARAREESCGGHFREEYQTEDSEARRDDENFAHVAAWEFRGVGEQAIRHVEPLEFEEVSLVQRSYK